MDIPKDPKERRVQLKIFMRKNGIDTRMLAEKTGYSKPYLNFSFSRAAISDVLRLSLIDAGIPGELLPPLSVPKKRGRCAHNEQKICNSQA